MMNISVVVPTYNRVDRLKKTIQSLENQTYPKNDFEVIIVSDGSTDGTDEYLSSINTPLQLTYLRQNNQGPAAARNEGIKNAQGDIILFIDDDIVATPELIAEHYASHQLFGQDAVVIGPMISPDGYPLLPWIQWEQTLLTRYYREMLDHHFEPSPRQFYTGNASIATRYLRDCGGFDTTFRRAEDVELAYRLNDLKLHFYFNEKAVGYHYAERSYQSWENIAYAYGKNDVIFTIQKKRTWLLPVLFKEYHLRHLFVRGLMRICLDRPFLSKLALRFFKGIMTISNQMKVSKITQYACSAIFNLRYYQGLCDELGGREKFFDGIAHAEKEK